MTVKCCFYWTLIVGKTIYDECFMSVRLHYFEPGGREFESLRARHLINKLSARSGPLISRVGTM